MTDTLLRRVKDSAIPPTPHYNQRQPRFTWLTTIWLTRLLPLRLFLLRRRSRALRPSSRFHLILARNLAPPNANLPPAKVVAIVLGVAAVIVATFAFVQRAKPQGGGSIDNI